MTNRIAESEMILNEDGSVYHLNLHPDELADTVILVGDPDRVSLVSKHFDRIDVKKDKREFITHTGYIGSKRLTVVSTGIGTDNIDIVLNELDALVNIDLHKREVKSKLKSLTLLRFGTAGALQADIPVDSLVVSSWAIGMDNLLHFYQLPEADGLSAAVQAYFAYFGLKPYMAKGDAHLVELFAEHCIAGITATCCGFYAPQGRQLRGVPRHPGLLDAVTAFAWGEHRVVNFEMETSGLYGLSQILGHRACSVSCIVANRITRQFSQDPHTSIEKMIEYGLGVLTK